MSFWCGSLHLAWTAQWAPLAVSVWPVSPCWQRRGGSGGIASEHAGNQQIGDRWEGEHGCHPLHAPRMADPQGIALPQLLCPWPCVPSPGRRAPHLLTHPPAPSRPLGDGDLQCPASCLLACSVCLFDRWIDTVAGRRADGGGGVTI